MTQKMFTLALLVIVTLSACGTNDTTPSAETQVPEDIATATLESPPTVVSSPTATSEPPATISVAPTLPPEDTPTPLPTATLLPPVNAMDCTNEGKFISDVTIPDNSDVNVGETFTKTWRVRNIGTCIWWEEYSVTHYSEGSFSAPKSAPLPRTNPGETADVSIDLVAPNVAGSYRGNFVIQNPQGLPMSLEGDSRLWVLFNAVGTSTEETAVIATTVPGGEEENNTGDGTTLNLANCGFTLDNARRDGVLVAINAYRAESGLPPYTMNQKLSNAAQSHAQDMACNNLFVHTGSDGSTPETRAISAGYTAKVTENVYGSYPPLTPEEAKEWWRLDQIDPRHNLNLISTTYTEVGIGYAFYENFGYYVVLFGQGE